MGSENSELFFESQKGREKLRHLKRELELWHSRNADELKTKILAPVLSIVESMIHFPSRWDTCEYCVSHHLTMLTQWMNSFTESSDVTLLKELFVSLHRFLVEFSVNFGVEADMHESFMFPIEFPKYFSETQWTEIRYSYHILPMNIFRGMIFSSEAQNLISLKATISDIESRKKKWNDDVSEVQKRADELHRALQTYKHGFNFAGLYRGFDNLKESKAVEKKDASKMLSVLAVLTLTPLIANIIHLGFAGTFGLLNAVISVSCLSLFAVSMYYFRVVLHNYKSLQSQILQIDLRLTLCQFIQSYVEYAGEVGNNELLDKFESIIFSNIVPDGSQIPAVHDGVEELAKLVAAIKKG